MGLNKILARRFDNFGAQIITFGVFGLLNYPVSYIYTTYKSGFNNQELALRLIAALLCTGLILHKKWKESWRPYLPIYWYFSILFCIPFFGSYLLMMSNFSLRWLMNDVLGLFLLILIIDWLMFLILLFLGIFSSFTIYYLINGSPLVDLHEEHIYMAIYMYSFATIVGAIFSRNREKMQDEKIRSMKTVAGTIANEMRTPLKGILHAAEAMEKQIPILVNGYRTSMQKNLIPNKIDEHELNLLEIVPENISSFAKNGLHTIEMLLTKLSENPKKLMISELDIQKCVETALDQFPFLDGERELVYTEIKNFKFNANVQMMMHVFFNLIKNSLYYIAKAQKGEITISTSSTENYNLLIFRDTAMGISENIKNKIFNKFYSSSDHGSGIGLSFCKEVMENISGKITCNSREGEYAEFILHFPKITKNDK